jgi:hypothetical protein
MRWMFLVLLVADTAQAARSLHERWGSVIRTLGVKLD